MRNRYLNRQAKRKKSNYHGRVSEVKAVTNLGGRNTPGSGALPGAKSDGYTPVFQYEHKSTVGQSFSVKHAVLNKVLREARAVGRIPVLLASFVFGSGKAKPNGEFVLLRKDDFIDLVETAMGDSWKFDP